MAHFPSIVLFFYTPFSGTKLGPGNGAQTALLLVLIYVLTCLVRTVELRGKALFTLPRATGLILLLLVSAFGLKGAQLAFYSVRMQYLFNALSDRDVYRCGKMFRILHPFDSFCEITEDKHMGKLMLIGNSHADAIKKTFSKVAQEHGYGVLFSVPNDPLLNPKFGLDWLLKEARARGVSAVFFHYSAIYALPDLVNRAREKLSAAGIRSVVIMPIPFFDSNPLADMYMKYRGEGHLPNLDLETFNRQLDYIIPKIHAIKDRQFKYYDIAPSFCNPRCLVADWEGRPYYFDSSHLTLTGARLLEQVFAAAFTELGLARK